MEWNGWSNIKMNEDDLLNRKEKRAYLETWLEHFHQAQQMVPRVQRELEKTEWEIEALSNLPDEAVEIPRGEITILLNNDIQYLQHEALPMIPGFDPTRVSSSDAISTSGTASVYEYISRVGDINTPKAYEFSNHYTLQYQAIQAAHDRPNEIRGLLTKLTSRSTTERFERAENSYMQFKAGTGDRTAAAIEMRTFLDGLSGDLFQLARKTEKENMTWAVMAERLSPGGATGIEYAELIRQKNIRSPLVDRLSTIGKDREGGSLSNLGHIWTELLDHSFTVLSIVSSAS
jgi:hypothetical protein